MSQADAFSNGDKVDAFFGNAQNKNDFMSILGDKKLTDDKKANRLVALGLERIQLPGKPPLYPHPYKGFLNYFPV